MHLYKLIGRLPVPCSDMDEWGVCFGSKERLVAQTHVGCLFVSTVFLGIDHRFFDDGDPLLFETMVFDDGDDAYQVRCSTWEQAERQHAEAVSEAERRVSAVAAALDAAQWTAKP